MACPTWQGRKCGLCVAFLGGWGTVLLLYGVATRGGRTSVAASVLAGIAIGALSDALSGLLIYVADQSGHISVARRGN